MTPNQDLAEQYRHVSRLWDGPRNEATACGLCFTFAAPTGNVGLGYYDRHYETGRRLYRLGLALGTMLAPDGTDRGFRATVGAILAAMIEAGDDPLDWDETP